MQPRARARSSTAVSANAIVQPAVVTAESLSTRPDRLEPDHVEQDIGGPVVAHSRDKHADITKGQRVLGEMPPET